MIAIAAVAGCYLLACFLLYMLIPFLYEQKMAKFMLLPNQQRINGLTALVHLLRNYGLWGIVRIQIDADYLDDCYGPESGILHISPQTATSTSLGALAVVAHEIAHAAQRRLEAGTAVIAITRGFHQIYYSLWTVRWLSLLSGLTLVYIKELLPLGFFLIALATFTCIPGIAGAWARLLVERDATSKGLQLLSRELSTDRQELIEIKKCLLYAAATYKLELLQHITQLLFFIALTVVVTII